VSKAFSLKRDVVFSNGDETYARQFAPRDDIVPNILTHGLVILSARPKAGKSGLAYSIAMSVANGDKPLGVGAAGSPADVLFIDFENGDEINQRRQRTMFPGGNKPSLYRLTHAYNAPRFDDGLFDVIEDWRRKSLDPRMVIIDVYGKAKPARKPRMLAPDDDNRTLEPLHAWANEHRICVMLLLHNRRGPENPDDILGSVLGSTAMTGTPDICMILIRRGGETTLHATGRKLAGDQHVALARDRDWYTILGEAQKTAESVQRRAIKAALADHGKLAVRDIADISEMKPRNVSKLLHHMFKTGEVVRFGEGRFTVYELPKGGMAQKRETGNAKPVSAEKPNELKGSIDSGIVTDTITDAPEQPITVTNPTDQDAGPVTTETSLSQKAFEPSVTDSTKTPTPSMSEDQKVKYLLNWLVDKGTVSVREAQQRCSPNLSGNEIRSILPVMAERGWIAVEQYGRSQSFQITREGSLTVDPQISLFDILQQPGQ
jgi:predicted transcriptional regulator